MKQPEKTPRVITGRVLSAKMDKTVTVEVERLIPHPVYGKYIRRSSKLLAHDENNICKEGDVVSVASCKPVSKRKVWMLLEVLNGQRTQS